MSAPFVPRVGGVLSADIAVPEHEQEVRFYAEVLGTGPEPLWREDLMNNLGMPVIGLGVRGPEFEDLPLQWMPHIQVADVAASVERAIELGGNALMHGRDDDGSSQWAVLLDPDGAAFGVIPVVPAEMLPPAGDATRRAGRIARLDLTVSDAAKAQDFYTQVIGWSMPEVDGETAAAIHSAEEGGGKLPPIWLIALPVGDLEESLRRVRDGGGEVLHAVRGADGASARAVIRDPVGACIALVPG
jgi:predicted enzyme related to lactoylglutathione lyase